MNGDVSAAEYLEKWDATRWLDEWLAFGGWLKDGVLDVSDAGKLAAEIGVGAWLYQSGVLWTREKYRAEYEKHGFAKTGKGLSNGDLDKLLPVIASKAMFHDAIKISRAFIDAVDARADLPEECRKAARAVGIPRPTGGNFIFFTCMAVRPFIADKASGKAKILAALDRAKPVIEQWARRNRYKTPAARNGGKVEETPEAAEASDQFMALLREKGTDAVFSARTLRKPPSSKSKSKGKGKDDGRQKRTDIRYLVSTNQIPEANLIGEDLEIKAPNGAVIVFEGYVENGGWDQNDKLIFAMALERASAKLPAPSELRKLSGKALDAALLEARDVKITLREYMAARGAKHETTARNALSHAADVLWKTGIKFKFSEANDVKIAYRLIEGYEIEEGKTGKKIRKGRIDYKRGQLTLAFGLKYLYTLAAKGNLMYLNQRILSIDLHNPFTWNLFYKLSSHYHQSCTKPTHLARLGGEKAAEAVNIKLQTLVKGLSLPTEEEVMRGGGGEARNRSRFMQRIADPIDAAVRALEEGSFIKCEYRGQHGESVIDPTHSYEAFMNAVLRYKILNYPDQSERRKQREAGKKRKAAAKARAIKRKQEKAAEAEAEAKESKAPAAAKQESLGL